MRVDKSDQVMAESPDVNKLTFEKALTETRPSVTEDMENDYARIQDTLKADAVRPLGGIGFVTPGMLQPKPRPAGKA